MNNYEEKIIQDKKCRIYRNGEPEAFLIQAVGEHDIDALDREAELITGSVHIPVALAAFQVCDWNRELSPWEAPAVFGEENFGSGAEKTLSFITDALLPELWEDSGRKRCYLGGYSLSGLFSLWAAYQTYIFSGVAAVSPSVWFHGWTEHIGAHTIQSPAVYLSLGDKEEKARNKTLASVGDNIRRQYELLRTSPAVKKCTLEWNPGNHFTEPELRTAKGFAWLLNDP